MARIRQKSLVDGLKLKLTRTTEPKLSKNEGKEAAAATNGEQ